MLREVVERMEERYTTYFNDISAFGKDYVDFGLPPIILIFMNLVHLSIRLIRN